MITYHPRAHFPKPVREVTCTYTHTQERSECLPGGCSLDSLGGERQHRGRAADQERGATRRLQRARGWGRVSRFSAPTAARAGLPQPALAPQGRLQPRSPAPPRGLLQFPPGPWGGRVCRGAAGAGAEAKRIWARQTNPGRVAYLQPPSRARAHLSAPSSALALRLQSVAGSGDCSAEARDSIDCLS